ncbi:OLC1v1024433C1 [Oldenlandia corymbosa var. corymbosa]|uniref:OLC1v1024433C1 n=1 Tax=Oldenlandia corymbosa var. corymbosa TaxID=529605 RepID=A0AAV1C444_OLDCO|nr:OLC1v1024433C1 [Oldenlandia corymbosa var. corymbosa]
MAIMMNEMIKLRSELSKSKAEVCVLCDGSHNLDDCPSKMEDVQFVRQGNAGGFNNFNNWRNQQQPNWNNAPQEGSYQRPTQPPGFHRQDGQPPNYQNQQRSNQQYIPREDEWISVQNAIKNLAEQATEKPRMEQIQFPAPIKEPQQPAPISPYPEQKGISHPNLISESAEMSDTQGLYKMPPARRKVAARKRASSTRVISSSESSSERQRVPTPPPSPVREPTPPRSPQPPRALQEQALDALTDELEPRLGSAFVRAISVNCSTEAIRAIWKLPRVSTDYRDAIAALHPNQPLEQAVLSRLAKEGTSWEMDDQENPQGFPANALQAPDLNLWHYFICCNLMPTSYTAKVTYEMAMPLSQTHHLMQPQSSEIN